MGGGNGATLGNDAGSPAGGDAAVVLGDAGPAEPPEGIADAASDADSGDAETDGGEPDGTGDGGDSSSESGGDTGGHA
jgi:hypothetical protein